MTKNDDNLPLSSFYADGSGSRRDLLQASIGLAASAGAGSAAAKPAKKTAKPAARKGTPIAQQTLPFADDALAPVISANTLSFHYGKHYKAYCDATAKLVAGTPLEFASLEEIIAGAAPNTEQKKLFNNAAQAWNHVFYWNSLSPKQQMPSGKLLDAITRDFGDLSGLNAKLTEIATGQLV